MNRNNILNGTEKEEKSKRGGRQKNLTEEGWKNQIRMKRKEI